MVNSPPNPILKTGVAAGLIAFAIWFGLEQFRAFRHSGQDGSRVWFYNVESKSLYSEEGDAIAPVKHSGNEGVRAMVVGFDGKSSDPTKCRIAYLETFTPELKGLLEQVKSARAAGRVYDGKIPARGGSFFESNTLVRRAEETEWHPVNTPEGQKIMAEWKSWRGPNGERPLASVP